MIGFDGLVRAQLNNVASGGQQLVEHSRVGRRAIGAHHGRAWGKLKGTSQEPPSGRQIPLLADQDVDDLAELGDRPIQIDPAPGDSPFTRGIVSGTLQVTSVPGQRCSVRAAASIWTPA